EESTKPTDNYTANQTIIAGYGLADFRFTENLRLQVGARVESSDQEVNTFSLFTQGQKSISTKLETTDVLPAGNLTWEFWRDKIEPEKKEPEKKEGMIATTQSATERVPQTMLLRLGGSQTVSRPEFRELAPFDYQDVLGGYTARGNPNLQRAKIINLDL